MQNTQEPLLTIRCLTYNHEPYIRQCLEGFVMQQTNFKFIAIVHDDASTDGTAAIVREYADKYPDIIKPIFQTENQYSQKNGGIRRAFETMPTGKYIAICEGDDYWTDPLKLQKQVDFLEANEEYGMVFTNARIFNQNKNCFFEPKDIEHRDFTFYDLLGNNQISTLTTCFRKHILDDYYINTIDAPKVITGDYRMWLYFATQSKIKRIIDITSVYRILDNSASHKKENQEPLISGIIKLFEYYVDKYIKDKNNNEFKKLLKVKSKVIRSFIINSPTKIIVDEYVAMKYKYNNYNIYDKIFKFCVYNNLVSQFEFCRKVSNKFKNKFHTN